MRLQTNREQQLAFRHFPKVWEEQAARHSQVCSVHRTPQGQTGQAICSSPFLCYSPISFSYRLLSILVTIKICLVRFVFTASKPISGRQFAFHQNHPPTKKKEFEHFLQLELNRTSRCGVSFGQIQTSPSGILLSAWMRFSPLCIVFKRIWIHAMPKYFI